MSKSGLRLCLGIAIAIGVPALVSAQDFRQTYRLERGGTIIIGNVSGDVKVTGTNSDSVTVTGTKTGRDLDQVSVEDRSTGNTVEIRAKYPEHCRNCNASINFQVEVPSGASFRFEHISSVSGNVEVASVQGQLNAKSVSGNVVVRNITGPVNAQSVSGEVHVEQVVGSVNAKSTSGNVSVDISRLEGNDAMEFASVSGNVEVKVPAGLNADAELSVLSGSLKTDFPLQIEERNSGPGRRAHGQIGGGERRLKMSSVSGNVSLLHN
jgi:hypothetical protein